MAGCFSAQRATARPLALCRSIRTARVRRPRSTSQAVWGSIACPQTRSRRLTSSITEAEPATAPATRSLWPLRYLVALVMTTSAPCSSGRKLIGLAKVASTRRASPNSRATCASGARSSTRMTGLVGVSTKMARVVFRTERRQSRGCGGIHEGDLDAQAHQLLAEEPPGAAVDPAAADEMVAGTQHREVRQRRGPHAAGRERSLPRRPPGGRTSSPARSGSGCCRSGHRGRRPRSRPGW